MGVTRLLLTRIPHFREVVLMALECPHCSERNNEVQFAGQLQPKGSRWDEVRFHDWILRFLRRLNVEHFLRWKGFLYVLRMSCKSFKMNERLAPSSDPLLSIRFYERTHEQQVSLGFLAEPNATNESGHADDGASTNNNIVVEPHGSVGAVAGRHAIAHGNPEEVSAALCRYSAPEEVDTLPSTCGACGTACVTCFYATKIPYFREVIVVATTCDICSYHSAELKPGCEISKKEKKITLYVKNVKDLTWDVMKSDSAGVKVPELDLELASGTLGGLATTVEGLITKISERVREKLGAE